MTSFSLNQEFDELVKATLAEKQYQTTMTTAKRQLHQK